MKHLSAFFLLACLTVTAMSAGEQHRALWGSIMNNKNATYFHEARNKMLISWRWLPSDVKGQTAFDLYRSIGGVEQKLNDEPIVGKTNFQDLTASTKEQMTYRLTYAGQDETLATYSPSLTQMGSKLPYIAITLTETTDVHATFGYTPNDAGAGDVDGDGEYEIILKRCLDYSIADDSEEETALPADDETVRHTNLLECYKLDGTMLWRLKSGPNIILGNSWSFAVADFNGDGRAEVAVRTSEGTVFGDGTEIGDTDGDGTTYYRTSLNGSGRYIGKGPEFFSVLDGTTGRELARADYIARETSESWGDNYWKRASSYRLGAACVSGDRPSVLIGRGVYGRSVVEAWDLSEDNKLSRRWRFDTNSGYSAWAGQGFHSLSVGDVDDDGMDEIVYGAITIDHDGSGLNNSRLGHGDALHLGKFRTDLDGLQIWSCFESGKTNAALRDAKTGTVIWAEVGDSEGDCGRAMVADIDPNAPGCEMWWAGGNARNGVTSEDLGYKPSSCNMAIWFGGRLNRQLLNETTIDYGVGFPNKPSTDSTSTARRLLTGYKYNVTSINSSKSNPCWYGDILGDWREEVIFPTQDGKAIYLFTTWYPTDYAYPWLMTDHVYEMSSINQNIGYNQPNQLGYYLGSDQPGDYPSAIESVKQDATPSVLTQGDRWFNLMGVETPRPTRGLYIHHGTKCLLK